MLDQDLIYTCWERGDSLRAIQEIDPHAADPKLGVVYYLYRAQDQWHQDPAKRRRVWVYCRQGYCRTETFERWLKGATQMKDQPNA